MSALPTTAGAVISALTRALVDAGHDVEPAPEATTLEEAARALFTLCARARASFFSVWVDTLEEGTPSAGVTLLFLPPPTSGPGGAPRREPQRIHQPFAPELQAPWVQALATVSQRSREPGRPSRGQVALPPDAAVPDLLFLVDFKEGERGTEVSALARDRQAQALFRPFSALRLSPEEAALLEQTFAAPQGLFEGNMVLFTGEDGPLRTAAWRAALGVTPRDLNVLVALERPLPLDPRVGAVVHGGELTLERVIGAFSRQDPDLVFIETVRTREQLRLLAHIAKCGRGVAALLDVATPEAALQMLNAAAGTACLPLLVHHSRLDTGEARLTVHAVTYPSGEEPQVVRWTPALADA